MTKLHDLADLGQSIWLDYIRRNILESGELNQLHRSGVRGVTSNPSIFEQAIARSDDYDDDLDRLIREDRSAKEIYEALAIEDIQHACDVFIDLYRQSDGADGYVSLEADPRLADKTEETIQEARRLFAAVDRPNLYIKVPATLQGIPAIRQLISEGINVNVTLIFSIDVYEQVAEAYLSGLEALVENGGNPRDVSSVASFFVSRVDSKVDKQLVARGNESLLGTIGIANAKVAYQRFLDIFSGPRWEALAERGARVQRPLWGSTSTKDPRYPDTLYVDNLIGPHTVNTVPPETLEAIMDHARVERTIDRDPEAARQLLLELQKLGIDLGQVTDELLDEGVEKFAAAFDSLLQAIEARKLREQSRLDGEKWDAALGPHRGAIRETVVQLQRDHVLERLWQKDHTLWSDDPDEISNRLGWLELSHTMQEELAGLGEFAAELQAAGIRQIVLLGMGGSSLAPELFARTFGGNGNGIPLRVLDSTDPEAISAVRAGLNPHETAFIVSSKSGGTVETISLFKYFYNWAASSVGEASAGDHFMAITDKGSKLAELAQRFGFRKLFLSNPDVGGRYSALSHFGLAPAALAGVDVDRLLASARQIDSPENSEKALKLGAMLGALALDGRDKLTLIVPPELDGFGEWLEQLIAESTGKDGNGILPVLGETLLPPELYGNDRQFVYFSLTGRADEARDRAIARILEAGHPLLTIPLRDRYDLGAQFVLWEIATAIAGHILGIHPFNQPNVESAKVRAKEMLAAYRESGTAPGNVTTLQSDGIDVQELVWPADTAAEALSSFLDRATMGSYVALQAYVASNAATDHALETVRRYIAGRTGAAVTVGYGPRFLHSTGQLHKGGSDNGLFIQLVSTPLRDLPIPNEAGSPASAITFGTLKLAQAFGDAQALKDAGRHVIRFMFGGNTADAVARLMAS